MKSFLEVEATRRAYHADPARNSVHRASLLVPTVPSCRTEISFLNHFLLKRNYDSVACRITGIDREGQRTESRLLPVSEPRVYAYDLAAVIPGAAVTYLVEFFAADNLFIPFPAVMVNHRGDNFLNSLHAYNRLLNDVFEDDAINAVQQHEASIDLRVDSAVDTFILFSAGAAPVDDTIEVELLAGGRRRHAEIPIRVPRLTQQRISIREAFGLDVETQGALMVRQPPQPMFYGRLLAGQVAADGGWSANHSYYDSSGREEYWPNSDPSYRLYPYFAGHTNGVRVHPIMSPSRLRVSVTLHGRDGRMLRDCPAGELLSPGNDVLDVDVDKLAAAAGVDLADLASFCVWMRTADGRNPTRTNHQLVYGSTGLPSSINVSLGNNNVFRPSGKGGFIWGQVPVAEQIDTWLGITSNHPGQDDSAIKAGFYGPEGLIARRTWVLAAGSSVRVNLTEELTPELGEAPSDAPAYLWYVIRSGQPGLSAYSVTRHKASGHCSGEHNF